MPRIPRFHCITAGSAALAAIDAVLAAGVDCIQVRDKSMTSRELVAFASSVVGLARPRDVTVIVNDRLDVALAAGADGVHLGREDMAIADARRIAPSMLIGATCRNLADATNAAADGADYIGVGPIYTTFSKNGLPDPLGVKAISAAVGKLPVIGIGGIDATNAAPVLAAGAHGVAVIGGVWNEPDPAVAAARIVGVLA